MSTTSSDRNIYEITRTAFAALTHGTDVMVKRSGSKAYRRAYLLSDAYTAGEYLLVTFAFYKPGYADTISGHDHVAVYGQDHVAVAR